jgi:hypothetical protein
MRTPPFQLYCDERAKKLSFYIYRATMKRVSPARIKKISARLFAVAGVGSTYQEMNNLLDIEERAILKQNKYNSLKVWDFCGSTTMRLCTQIGLKGGEVKFTDFCELRRRLFKAVNKEEDDAGVNAKIDVFFEQVLSEYSGQR